MDSAALGGGIPRPARATPLNSTNFLSWIMRVIMITSDSDVSECVSSALIALVTGPKNVHIVFFGP